MNKLLPTLTLVFLLTSLALRAQFTVTQNAVANQLIQALQGQGVTISNPVVSCPTCGIGTFNNGNAANLGVNQGVVLTTGVLSNSCGISSGIPNPSISQASNNQGGAGDADLQALASTIFPSIVPLTTRDACVLEFDIIPSADTLKFTYVFGSEEYDEFVCSPYTDVFAFFITGPNPSGGNYNNQNLALIPGTNIPVAINTINNGSPGNPGTGTYPASNCLSLSYSNYYVSNFGSQNLVYDGLTVPLSAIAHVTPCQSYHIKIAIADLGTLLSPDYVYDSGVFLEANSFQSGNVAVLSQSAVSANFPNAVEGCGPGQFKFVHKPALTVPYTINYTVTGTAVNGTDYTAITNSITIPANDTVAYLTINATADGVPEGTETVTINILGCNNQIVTSATLNIQDAIVVDATATRYAICQGESTTLTATGALTYQWTPNTALTAPNSATTNASPTSTITYTVTGSVGACTATDTVRINVAGGPGFTVDAGADVTACANQAVMLQPTFTQGSGPYTYQWSPTTNMNAGGQTQENPIVSPTQTTTYSLTVTTAAGCTATDNVTITIAGLAPIVQPTATPSLICPGQQVQLNFNSTPQVCGPVFTPGCAGVVTTDSLGTGSTSQSGNPALVTTVYGNYRRSARMQILYSAAELISIFGTGGTIQTLSWQIGIFNSNASLDSFTIGLKCVPSSQTTLTTWETGLQPVFGPVIYTPVPGWNNHNLSTYYDWDGVSGLVVEICYYNSNSFGNINNMMTYNTINSSMLYSTGQTNICGINAPITISNQRPKMRVRICQPNYATMTINWTPNSGSNTVSNPSIRNPTTNPVTTQTYQVNVNTGGTCDGVGFVTVYMDTTWVDAGPDRSFCTGQQVQLSATAHGVPLPGQNFTYQWRQLPAGTVVGNTPNVTVTPSGNSATYVVAMSGSSCTVYDTVVVQIGSLLVNHTATNVTCNGAANGKLTIQPGGNPPYTYQWGNGVAGNVDSAVNLGPGTYTVTVSDALNCSGSATMQITQPTAFTIASSSTNVSCNGGNNGSITITPSGGTGAASYQWSNGLPGIPNVTGLQAGSYSVTARDANQCSATGTYIITEPTPITFNPAVVQNVRCLNGTDGAITVFATGGTPLTGGVYNYAWSHNGNLNQPNATNLPAATYTVVVTDANNCTASQANTVTQPANGITFNAPVIVEPACFGAANGSAAVNPTGGAGSYAYQWAANANNQTTQTASGLAAGTYSVTVRDDSLCTATTSVTLTNPAQIQITEAVTNVSCYGGNNGAINITVSNAVGTPGFNWNPGGLTTEDINGQTAGTYTVTVTDANNCTQTGTYVITEPLELTLAAPNVTNVSCYGGNNGSVTANPTGGTQPYGYAWTPGGQSTRSISTLTAGSYTVIVTDANNCTVTDTYPVTEPATALTFNAPTIVEVRCNGAATGSITVNATGGTPATGGVYTYTWGHNAQLNNATAQNLTAGQYPVTVTDANSCTITAVYDVTQPPAITFGQSVVTDVSCFGSTDGTAEVFPSGGVGTFTFTWNGVAGPNPLTGMAAGQYTVVVTDNNNCTASTQLTVGQPQALLVNPIPVNAACFNAPNGSIDANPSGGNAPFTYQWNDANAQTTQMATGLIAGIYSVTVTDATGCSVVGTDTVQEPSELLFTMDVDAVSCVGDKDGKINVFPTGGTPPYNYSVTQDWAIFIFSTDGVIQGLDPGYYAVIVADDNGCTKVDTAFVPDAVADTYTITADSTSCFGPEYADGAIHVIGNTIVNQPYQYSLDGGPAQYSGDFYFVGAGEHTVTGINNFGCTTDLAITVPEPAPAVLDVMPVDSTLQLGETIQLVSAFGPYPTSTIVSYNWTPSTGLSCIDCPNPLVNPYSRQNEYFLTITYNDHCVVTASLKILVENGLDVYIPNTFSPNGDGNNDVFLIYGQGIKVIDLVVFNRWGEKVYESNSQYAGWDGTYKGVPQNPGVYVYDVRITFLDNRKTKKTGSITILR